MEASARGGAWFDNWLLVRNELSDDAQTRDDSACDRATSNNSIGSGIHKIRELKFSDRITPKKPVEISIDGMKAARP